MSLVKAYRMHGHLNARLDPLGSEPMGDPALDESRLQPPLTDELQARIPARLLRLSVPGENAARGPAAPPRGLHGDDRLRDRAHLRSCRAGLAAAGDRVGPVPRRARSRGAPEPACGGSRRSRASRRTSAAPSSARSSSRSRDSTSSCRCSTRRSSWPPEAGAHEVLIGIAHRGRLNVLAHTVGRSYASILREFEGERSIDALDRRRGRGHGRRQVPPRRLGVARRLPRGRSR